jgi:hypothetical protein
MMFITCLQLQKLTKANQPIIIAIMHTNCGESCMYFVKEEARCQGDYVMGGTRQGGWEPNKEGASHHIIPEGEGLSLA